MLPSSAIAWWADVCGVLLHYSTNLGPAALGEAPTNPWHVCILSSFSSRSDVAPAVSGQYWKIGYQNDPHNKPNSNHCLLFLIGSI